jgi:hypothetical protein
MRSAIKVDHELNAVTADIRWLDPQGIRTAQVLRGTLDQLYDGERTSRCRWDQLHKIERTHCGALVELNLHREFEFQDGTALNHRIAGIDVDCKYSPALGCWVIPPGTHGHLCLLVWAEDARSEWSMGIVRATADRVNTGSNTDRKLMLNRQGRAAIVWLFDHAALPPSLLFLHREELQRSATLNSARKRRNTRISHVDALVSGARASLQREGIIILGQSESHSVIARALGVPEPGLGESVSVRVVPAAALGTGVAEIEDRLWRVASASDPVAPAPELPKT